MRRRPETTPAPMNTFARTGWRCAAFMLTGMLLLPGCRNYGSSPVGYQSYPGAAPYGYGSGQPVYLSQGPAMPPPAMYGQPTPVYNHSMSPNPPGMVMPSPQPYPAVQPFNGGSLPPSSGTGSNDVGQLPPDPGAGRPIEDPYRPPTGGGPAVPSYDDPTLNPPPSNNTLPDYPNNPVDAGPAPYDDPPPAFPGDTPAPEPFDRNPAAGGGGSPEPFAPGGTEPFAPGGTEPFPPGGDLPPDGTPFGDENGLEPFSSNDTGDASGVRTVAHAERKRQPERTPNPFPGDRGSQWLTARTDTDQEAPVFSGGDAALSPHDYDRANYRWLRGVVDFDPQDQRWHVIYSLQPDSQDPLGGDVALVGQGLDGLKNDQVVTVTGEIDPSVTDAYGKACFRVTSVKVLPRK